MLKLTAPVISVVPKVQEIEKFRVHPVSGIKGIRDAPSKYT